MNTFNFLPEGWNDKTSNINLGNQVVGIMPREEVEAINLGSDGLPKQNLCTGKVHKFVQFKIKGFNQNNVPILSRKLVQQEAMSDIKENLKIGDRVNGIVKNITPYGAFIEIGGGVVGLVYIEDLSVARIKTPAERLKIGQKVNVVVKYIDKETGKISLSYKENYGTWEENAQKLKTGEKVTGIVRETEKNKNGIFIELSPNLVGMAEYKPGLKYGQKIDVYIKKIDFNKRKVKLFII